MFASPRYGPQPPSCVQQLLLDLQLYHAVPWNFDLKSNTIKVYSKVWCLSIDVSILGYPRSMFALLLPLSKLHCTTRLYVMLGTYVMVNPPPSHHTMSLNLLRQLVMLAILRRRDIATTGTQTRQGLFCWLKISVFYSFTFEISLKCFRWHSLNPPSYWYPTMPLQQKQNAPLGSAGIFSPGRPKKLQALRRGRYSFEL